LSWATDLYLTSSGRRQLIRKPVIDVAGHHRARVPRDFLAVPEQDHGRNAADIELLRDFFVFRF